MNIEELIVTAQIQRKGKPLTSFIQNENGLFVAALAIVDINDLFSSAKEIKRVNSELLIFGCLLNDQNQVVQLVDPDTSNLSWFLGFSKLIQPQPDLEPKIEDLANQITESETETTFSEPFVPVDLPTEQLKVEEPESDLKEMTDADRLEELYTEPEPESEPEPEPKSTDASFPSPELVKLEKVVTELESEQIEKINPVDEITSELEILVKELKDIRKQQRLAEKESATKIIERIPKSKISNPKVKRIKLIEDSED